VSVKGSVDPRAIVRLGGLDQRPHWESNPQNEEECTERNTGSNMEKVEDENEEDKTEKGINRKRSWRCGSQLLT
jgi:hypothetical protein